MIRKSHYEVKFKDGYCSYIFYSEKEVQDFVTPIINNKYKTKENVIIKFKKCLLSSNIVPTDREVPESFKQFFDFRFYNSKKERRSEEEIKKDKISLKEIKEVISYLKDEETDLILSYETLEKFHKNEWWNVPADGESVNFKDSTLKGYMRVTSDFKDDLESTLKKTVSISKSKDVMWWGLFNAVELPTEKIILIQT